MDPVIDATLRTALALLFLVAAGHKLRDLGRFRATLADYRLVPAGLVPLAAALVVGAEAAAAGALPLPGAPAAGLRSPPRPPLRLRAAGPGQPAPRRPGDRPR